MQAYVGGALECMCVGEKTPCRTQFSLSWVLGKAISLAATAFTCSAIFVILRLGLNVQLGLALNADLPGSACRVLGLHVCTTMFTSQNQFY